MDMWVGKIKGYNCDGKYIGTYRAVIVKDGDILFRMNLYFDATNNKSKCPFNKKVYFSSNLDVLKRKFRTSLPTKEKAKVLWKKKVGDC
ncbi:hypothetical protein ACFFHM_09170 [Halalkalibacter kiskunsagensis]|uniref:Uncharacterized protein n=1 Tax=Halalkalibacter kiskunsagensis TaxID=1548599 RepID=A0ABV6KC85_9BACI